MNEIDKTIIHRVFNFYLNIVKYKDIFSYINVGSNADNLVRVLKRFEKTENVHCFEEKDTNIDMYCMLNNIDEIDFIKIEYDDPADIEYVITNSISCMLERNKIICGMYKNERNIINKQIVSQLIKYGYNINDTMGDGVYVFYLV
jgi:hypothetical protein